MRKIKLKTSKDVKVLTNAELKNVIGGATNSSVCSCSFYTSSGQYISGAVVAMGGPSGGGPQYCEEACLVECSNWSQGDLGCKKIHFIYHADGDANTSI